MFEWSDETSSELCRRIGTAMRELNGNPQLNRVTRRPYSQAYRTVGDFVQFGEARDIGFTFTPDSPALMPDQIEDFALYCGLKALHRNNAQMEFCRFIVEAGLLEEGVAVVDSSVSFLPE